jgi:hypothetical protein
MKKLLYILLISTAIVGCGGGTSDEITDENTAPSVPSLQSPANNALCTELTLNIQWQAAVDGEGDALSYVLQVAKDAGFSNIIHESTISQTSKSLTVDSGENYYWRVKAKDALLSSDYSSAYSFYSEGEGIENHIPFAANLVAPSKGSSNAAGTIKLEWNATDLDSNDVLTYDVYVGTASDNLQSEASNVADKFLNTTVNNSGTYYWRVDVKDSNGGVSIGQVWEFSIL